MNSDSYFTGVVIVGVLSAILIWIYLMSTWDFLVGLILGLPVALIGGAILGFAWPLVLVVIAGLFIISKL